MSAGFGPAERAQRARAAAVLVDQVRELVDFYQPHPETSERAAVELARLSYLERRSMLASLLVGAVVPLAETHRNLCTPARHGGVCHECAILRQAVAAVAAYLDAAGPGDAVVAANANPRRETE